MNTSPPNDAVITTFIEEVVPHIRKSFAPQQLVLFGSRVRGDAREESDLDVIVVSEAFRDIPFVRRMALVLNSIRFHRHIDFICYTPDEFEHVRNASTIVRAALAEGITA